jgi:hypothetical protein
LRAVAVGGRLGERLLSAFEIAGAQPDLADLGEDEADVGELARLELAARAASVQLTLAPCTAPNLDSEPVRLAVARECGDADPGEAVVDGLHPLAGAAIVAEFVAGPIVRQKMIALGSGATSPATAQVMPSSISVIPSVTRPW